MKFVANQIYVVTIVVAMMATTIFASLLCVFYGLLFIAIGSLTRQCVNT
jgi:hypothetical protein